MQRALRVRRPDEDLDDVIDSLFGSWWVDGPEVGFAPSATVTVARLPGRSGAGPRPGGAARDRGRCRACDAAGRHPRPAASRRPPYAGCWPPCVIGCAHARRPESRPGAGPTRAMADSLATFLAQAPPATLVVIGDGAVGLASPGPATREEPWDLAVVVVRDRLDLRALASGLTTRPGSPSLGRARRVAVWLEASPALLPRPAGDLPPLAGTRSRRLPDGSWLVGAALHVRRLDRPRAEGGRAAGRPRRRRR